MKWMIISDIHGSYDDLKKVMEIYYSEPKIKDAPDAAAHTDHFKGKIESFTGRLSASKGYKPTESI